MKTIQHLPKISILFLIFLFSSLIYRIHLHCTSYFDLGIYSDALSRLKWNDLNPFIPGRNINIFNDHFDPILIPFSFLTSFFKASHVGIALEFLSLVLCWYPLRKLRDSKLFPSAVCTLLYTFILLNRSVPDAVQSPFHPTTWAILPLACVFCFYYLDHFRKLLISLVLLYACREEFPLIGIPLSLVYLMDRKRKNGLIVGALTLSWILFTFYIRPRIFTGTFQNYGGQLLQGFLSDPLSTLLSNISVGKARMFLERSIPLLLLVDPEKLRNSLGRMFRLAFITSPIFAVRLVSNQWGFHYGTAATVSLAFILLPSLSMNGKPLRTGVSIVFMLVIFVSEPIKVFLKPNQRCIDHSLRLAEIEKAQNYISKSAHTEILLENNLASTQFLRSGTSQNIHLLCSPTGSNRTNFDLVLVEKPDSGDAWPCGYSRISEFIERWRKDTSVKVIFDNTFIFLAEGVINQ